MNYLSSLLPSGGLCSLLQALPSAQNLPRPRCACQENLPCLGPVSWVQTILRHFLSRFAFVIAASIFVNLNISKSEWICSPKSLKKISYSGDIFSSRFGSEWFRRVYMYLVCSCQRTLSFFLFSHKWCCCGSGVWWYNIFRGSGIPQWTES